eukprot:gene2120-2610_t
MGKVVKKLGINECLIQFGGDLPIGFIFDIQPSNSSYQLYLAPIIE